ncbi:MAG TPA: efflux RND transporter periplasmic adaptor subunit [Thermoanaerobaculia bacterium]|nr:efflux RND transporter periplasmic adaptor subunit [Thermoanaerobaculia bacterium]
MSESREGPAGAAPARRSRVRTAAAVVIVVIVGAATARALVKSGGKGGPRAEVVPVTASTVAQQAVPLTTNAIGNVEAYSTVVIRALVAGEIQRIAFKQGQEVKKGDLLFQIDPRPYQAALDQAEGTLAKDKAQLVNARALEARYKRVYDEGIASKEDWDTYRTGADTQAALVRADEAAVENARVQLSYATIRSPISGTTGNLLVYEGNLVKATDLTTLVTITQTKPIYVTFAVPEGELGKVNRARAAGPVRVEASLPSDASRPVEGVLTFVDNAVDTTTGTIRLKATFDNAERRLWPGQFVRVTVTTGVEQNAVVVPSQAVQTGQDGPYVYVVKDDMTVEPRPVKTGPSAEGVVVVAKGLAAGERVVTDGQLRLFPGAKVELKTRG